VIYVGSPLNTFDSEGAEVFLIYDGKFMRSPREIAFRLRQEAANALLAQTSPNFALAAECPLAILPNPNIIANVLRGTSYAPELISTAGEILQGRIPIFNTVMEYGPTIAWRRDPRSGIESTTDYFRRIPYLDVTAAGDHKFVWEINRHQHLVLAAQAAVLSGSERYSDYVLRQLEHWWPENPFQRGINWTSALEVAFRVLSWIWVFHLIGDRMTTNFRQRFLAELYRHGLHLEYNLSIYFSPNTHLLGEAVALHAIGRLFPRLPRSRRWRTLGATIVHEHMQTCVREDGSYFEQSTYYHMYAVDMFVFHAVLENAPETYPAKLARMAEFLASLVDADGNLPFLGDDDGGRFFHPYGTRSRFARGSLACASVLLGKRFFPFSEYDLDEIASWWLGPECSPKELALAASNSSRTFQDTGIVVLRHGPIVALFDAGPFGPGGAGHSHSDTLSLLVSAGDQEILIDSGTFSYMNPEWRSYFRGSAAHNTIKIDARDQGVPAGPFRWSERPQVKLLEFTTGSRPVRAVAQCAYRGFAHTRTVALTDGTFTTNDTIEGPPGEHDIEQFWHFAREPRPIDENTWVIGDAAEFHAQGGVVEPSWRSRYFGTKEPSWSIVVRRRSTLPLTLQARLRCGD